MSSKSDFSFEALFAKRPTEIKYSLERVAAAYKVLGRPSLHTRTVLIAGTNGKGTTAAFLWRMLSQCGVKCGLYTSPHLRDFSERFLIHGETIDNQQIIAQWAEIKQRVSQGMYDSLTFFEVTTLIALTLFWRFQTQINILEVGLGGRLDATNITSPTLSVITGIDFDHQQFLGATLQEISLEKAGIMRPGVPVLVGTGGALQEESVALKTLRQHAKEIGAPINYLGNDFGKMKPQIDAPAFLQHNWSLALAAAQILVGEECVDAQMASDKEFGWDALTIVPCARGRFERRKVVNQGRRDVIFDVAHNIDGVRALCQSVETIFPGRSLPALVSILADKDVDGMIDILKGAFGSIVLFKNKNVRSFSPERLSERHRAILFKNDFSSAWQHAVNSWPKDVPWVVCGSVVAVGEVFEYFSMSTQTGGDSQAISPIILS